MVGVNEPSTAFLNARIQAGTGSPSDWVDWSIKRKTEEWNALDSDFV
jgi:hypothetical protein